MRGTFHSPEHGLLMGTAAAAAYIGRTVSNMLVWRQRNIGPRYLVASHPDIQRRAIWYRLSDLQAFLTAETQLAGRLPQPRPGRPRKPRPPRGTDAG
jgi:hypothetical protein